LSCVLSPLLSLRLLHSVIIIRYSKFSHLLCPYALAHFFENLHRPQRER
jgi:hypothetical protein